MPFGRNTPASGDYLASAAVLDGLFLAFFFGGRGSLLRHNFHVERDRRVTPLMVMSPVTLYSLSLLA
jgi:hypothetical protein